jgi:hypothetical protein
MLCYAMRMGHLLQGKGQSLCFQVTEILNRLNLPNDVRFSVIAHDLDPFYFGNCYNFSNKGTFSLSKYWSHAEFVKGILEERADDLVALVYNKNCFLSITALKILNCCLTNRYYEMVLASFQFRIYVFMYVLMYMTLS